MAALRERIASMEEEENRWWKWYNGARTEMVTRTAAELEEAREREVKEAALRERTRMAELVKEKEAAEERKLAAQQMLVRKESRAKEQREEEKARADEVADQKKRQRRLSRALTATRILAS